MPDLALATPEVVVELSPVIFGPGAGYGTTGWEAFLVDSDGSLIDTLDVVTWGDLSERMTEPASITLGIRVADVADLPLVESEVQIYRDGDLIFWGLPVNRKAVMGSPIVEVDFADLEAGLVRWGAAGTSIDTSVHNAGTQSAKMTATSGRVKQRLVTDQAMTIAVTARVRIDSTGYSGVGAESGLTVYASPWSGFAGRDVQAVDLIDGSEPHNVWITLAATVTIPTDNPYDVWITIKGIDGTLNVDTVTATPFRRARRTEAAGIFPPEEVPQIDTGRLAREILSGAVGDLFSGALIPGLVLVALYLVYILWRWEGPRRRQCRQNAAFRPGHRIPI